MLDGDRQMITDDMLEDWVILDGQSSSKSLKTWSMWIPKQILGAEFLELRQV